jgi:hypothetical protein
MKEKPNFDDKIKQSKESETNKSLLTQYIDCQIKLIKQIIEKFEEN